MYVRIYWGKIHPGSWPALEKTYEELMALSTPGLLGRLVTQDVADAESVFTITLWKDLESVRRWEASPEYSDLYLAAVAPHIIGSRSVSLCDVKVANLAGLLAVARAQGAQP